MSGDFQHLTSRAAIAPIAADIIASAILRDVNDKGRASIMLSGGSTPGATFEALSSYDLPWDKVDIGLVDDRWVNEDDKGSNGALLRRMLLKGKAKAANFTPMKTPHGTPREGLSTTNDAYTQFMRPFSLVLLGMGPDGHTASWFPDSEGLAHALDRQSSAVVAPITAIASDVTGPYLDRMTLTLPAIANATTALLLLTGTEKKSVFESANDDPQSAFPVRRAITALGDRLTVLYAD